MPMSREVFIRWRKYDVAAIFLASIPLTFALAYFVFSWWGVLINTLVAAVVAVAAACVFWRTPEDHTIDPAKHAVFVGLIVLCYLTPRVVATIREATRRSFTLASGMTIGACASLFVGAWCFVRGWPQKHAPGRFDVWGHSHQIMHVGVMSAHICEFFFLCAVCTAWL